MKLLVNSESAATNTIEIEVIAKKMGENATVGQHFAYCVEQAISKLPDGEAAKTAFIIAMNECRETAVLLKKIPAPAAELFTKCEHAQQLTNYLTNLYRFSSRAGIDAIATKYSAATTATTSSGCAADIKVDSKTAAPFFAVPTIALLPDIKYGSTPPRYLPIITYGHIKSALDDYDSEKGFFKKIGLRDDNSNIIRLREFYNSLNPTSNNLKTILDNNQLLSLAEIVSAIEDLDYSTTYTGNASNKCVMPIKNLFGIERCHCFKNRSYYSSLTLADFMAYFHILDKFSMYAPKLKYFIEKFPFIFNILIQNPDEADKIHHLLAWLDNRKILTLANIISILLHMDAIHLFIDMSNVDTLGTLSSPTTHVEWCNKTPEVMDPVFQQMLFDTVIKRAEQLKTQPAMQGPKLPTHNGKNEAEDFEKVTADFKNFNCESIVGIDELITWLKNRQIFTATNFRAILFHADAIDLFMDMASAVKTHRVSSRVRRYINWYQKSNQDRNDPVLQQMLFDTVIKRNVDRKAVALLCGLKSKGKESSIGKVFDSSGIADLKALKEIGSFLKPSPG